MGNLAEGRFDGQEHLTVLQFMFHGVSSLLEPSVGSRARTCISNFRSDFLFNPKMKTSLSQELKQEQHFTMVIHPLG